MKVWITTSALLILCVAAIYWLVSDIENESRPESAGEVLDSPDPFHTSETSSVPADEEGSLSYANWLREHRFRFRKLLDEYEHEILSLGLYYMLLPDNLADKQMAKQSRSRIGDFTSTVESYETRMLKELQQSESELSALTDDEGKAAYYAYIEEKEDFIRDVRKYFEIQKGILITTDELLAVAINRLDKLKVENRQLVIQDQETSDQYETLVAQLNDLGEQEERIMDKYQNNSSEGSDS
jgi:hypothetical protein